MQYAACEFSDNKLKQKRIVPVTAIREIATGAPFQPKGGNDFGPGLYEAKWQASFDGNEGYYPSEVLCLGGSPDGVMSKAADLGIKLPTNAVLEVKKRNDQEESSPQKDSRAQRKRRSDEAALSNTDAGKKALKAKGIPAKCSKNVQMRRKASSNKRPILVGKSGNAGGVKKRRLVKNKILANPVVNERLAAALRESHLKSDAKKALDFASMEKADKEEWVHEEKSATENPKKNDSPTEDGGQNQALIRSSSMETIPVTDDEALDLSEEEDSKCFELIQENLKLVNEVGEKSRALERKEELLTKANHYIKRLKEEVSNLQAHVKKSEAKITKLEGKVSSLEEALSKSKTSTPVENFGMKSSPEDQYDFQGDSSPIKVMETSASMSTPTNSAVKNTPSSSSKKKRKGHKIDIEDFKEINEVYTNVLGHLKGNQKLKTDVKGMVDVGLNVSIQEKALMNNFEKYSEDIRKISRNLTMMVWTKTERLGRSLDGSQSNRYPNAPKKEPATPHKINAVLGCVKAHLKNQGSTEEGPAMTLALEMSRKTIGLKFNEESTLLMKNTQRSEGKQSN